MGAARRRRRHGHGGVLRRAAIALALGGSVAQAAPPATAPAAAPTPATAASAPDFWRYDATIDGAAAHVIAWEGREPFAGAPAFYLETVTLAPDRRVDERHYYTRTAAGVALLGASTDIERAAGHELDDAVASAPELELPVSPQPGAKWDASTSFAITTKTPGQATPVKTSASRREVGQIVGHERISVPAGVFDCVVVRRTSALQVTDDATSDSVETTTEWYAPTVGLVQAATSTTSGESSRPSTRTLRLRAYHVTAPAWQMAAIGLVAPPESPESLAKRAAALAAAGDFAHACPLYAASWRAAPRLDTLLALADCDEHAGKLASAWSELRDAADRAKQAADPREADARRRADALVPRLPKLHVMAPPKAIAGLTVQRDGIDITAQLDQDVAIDPGEHEILVSAPGFVAWSAKIVIGADARTTELPVPVLGPAPRAPAPTPPPAPAATPAAQVAVTTPVPARPRVNLRKRGLVLAGIGGGALVFSAVEAVVASDKWNEAKKDCGGDVTSCPGEQLSAARDAAHAASSNADTATAGFIFGGVLVVTGTLLWALTPDHKPARTALHITPELGAHTAGIVLSKSW